MAQKNNNLQVHLIPSIDSDNEVLVKNVKWFIYQPILNQYIVRKFSIFLIYNYFKKVGFKWVLIKIKSRFFERERNKKYFGLCVGIIEIAPENSDFKKNDIVVFFAPNHSLKHKCLVINKAFVTAFKKGINTMPFINSFEQSFEYKSLATYASWTSFSGTKIDVGLVSSSLSKLAIAMNVNEFNIYQDNEILYTDKIVSNLNDIKNKNKPTAVLFGYGNYAKTAILPNINKYLNLKRIHEIDIDQLFPLTNKSNVDLFTSSIPVDNKYFDAWFIAGYHHTHINLAISALSVGSYAVVEKPLSTSYSDFQKFYDLVNKTSGSNFFVCFHKRYSSFNKLIRLDFNIIDNSPIDMHCIVYEIPLPLNHWYNWENSGSRIISNACHWIDYFMFLNEYSDVIYYKVWNPRDNEIVIQLFLSNKAILNLSLTDKGSERIGVRDYIELRKDKVTIKIIDGSTYESENDDKIIRRVRVNPLESYTKMYKTISEKIYKQDSGDSISSLKSSEITLKLEELLKSNKF